MEHAWLDSLSEDWVSQPRSSRSPVPSLPSLSNSTSGLSNAPIKSSRIPKFNAEQSAWTAPQEASSAPLSERSLNEHNIPLSQRSVHQSSKLRDEIIQGLRGRKLSRTVSASSAQSLQYSTVQHKSASLSPRKGQNETPEWRRRLLHGEVAYGDQCDLFSPAGLETLFRPPANDDGPQGPAACADDVEQLSTMPSSPPTYNKESFPFLGTVENQNDTEAETNAEQLQSRQRPRAVKYHLVSEDEAEASISYTTPDTDIQSTLGASLNGPKRFELHGDSSEHCEVGAEKQRIVSGQSDIRNEEFSPVYVGRQDSIGGNVKYAALGASPKQLPEMLKETCDSLPSSVKIDSKDRLDDFLDESSEMLFGNGGFINLRRGGYSQEGSFQKRLLSPSSLLPFDESAILPEESIQASTPKLLPHVTKTRKSDQSHPAIQPSTLPQSSSTPPTSPKKSNAKTTATSPLKLFGNYDTFTNQKLLRRLSQFEGDYDNQGARERPLSSEVTHARMVEASIQGNRKITSFGKGDLDDFQFSEEVSHNFNDSYPDNSQTENSTLPPLKVNKEDSPKFHLGPAIILGTSSQRLEDSTKTVSSMGLRRQLSSSLRSQPPASTKVVENLGTPRKKVGDLEGKRLPRSPFKDPTPKRRRTLQKSDFIQTSNEETASANYVNETHQQIQTVLGRKRKDARQGDDQQAANPKVLAMRQILRPRTSTLSQRGTPIDEWQSSEGAERDSFGHARDIQAKRIAQIQAELDLNEPEKASVSFEVSQPMQNESRKGSVTTQDFLDEAKKIMAGIRGKARSGLASLEESESENYPQILPEEAASASPLEDSYEESTREPFSRPPSREGKPVERLHREQEDPELLDHLRKYQEISDMDLMIASSVKSIAMVREAAAIAKEMDRIADETISRSSGARFSDDAMVESDPPNTRISENPEAQRKRKHSTSSDLPDTETHEANEYPSQGSNASQSTNRSIPTGSSHGSDSRRVIAPHTVSHLIPEELAGMFLDRERNIWIKRKPHDIHDDLPNLLPSDASEDDPFGDIPDLSVDETQELRRLKEAVPKSDVPFPKSHKEVTTQSKTDARATILQESRKTAIVQDVSRKISATSHSITSATQTVLRYQSFPNTNEVSHETMLNEPASNHIQNTSFHRQESIEQRALENMESDDVEREISILEDRIEGESPQRRRNVTISFSSPVAQVISSPTYEDDSSISGTRQGRSSGEMIPQEFKNGTMPGKQREPSQSSIRVTSTSTSKRSALRATSRRISFAGHAFSGRPVSRIDEHDEESFNKNQIRQHTDTDSVVTSTPLPARRESSLVLATPLPVEIGNLSLTPLSDFTMHQADRSFGMDVSYVESGRRYALGIKAKRTLSLSIKELVEKITQVEPYEPFWEHMKQLDLKDKRLTTLHKLDEFCEHLVDLDASHNRIAQLDGVPTSVRDLRITHNQLSDLAAWGHLQNLQYIDISNNEIESLSGFRHLVHLRGLRADNNRIISLDGISQLNGLLQLRLRGNLVETLDFTNTGLFRLTDLDVKGNKISQIRNLHQLRSVSSLNLEDNDLSEFEVSHALRSLRYLKLSGNSLERLDVARFPDLRLLYLDRNRLESVQGLLKTKHLDSLSMREQQDGIYIDTSFLSQALEIRKLFLSGNLLTTFQPRVEYLNLQYLELANCGIETLSPEFGYMIPNARVVNLNFNALKDIRPLAGIVRLKKLHLAGNRLSRLRTTTSAISEIQTLSYVDLRNNPLTQGFYPALSETRVVVHQPLGEEVVSQPFTLRDANRIDDTKYTSRLDQATKMRRRTFEMLVLSGCERIKTLDGLPVDRSVLVAQDVVWKAMVAAGLLKADEDHLGKAPPQMKERQSSEQDNRERLSRDADGSIKWDLASKSGEQPLVDRTRVSDQRHPEDIVA